ncbi:fibronectin type III domain-containing protein [Myxococcus sp. RHSTA-1-4]|uniref:fibronectin type III domain-containing protein n=1 Tax=Myxococcus sp. RHSTA-1-4 TaxID=2874601 RepID=UPI001CBD925F|nr:fibronectin type III domain-containing protein [Myxococcus sp. RHSTA-1-4]MBZ4420070.1 fibronectin type III domain-containing protein [Myxococcus sp. RHSTA-1-4]
MKRHLGVYVLSLLALSGALGCAGEYEEPAGNKVPVTFAAPRVPRDVVLSAGDSQVTVTWTAPEFNGGRRILNYAVRMLQGGAVVRTETLRETAVTFQGLTNGEEYAFTVAAINEVGEGVQSEPSATRPRVIPGAPREVSVTPGDRQVTVTWAAPEDTGMPITGYVAQALLGEEVVAAQTVTETTATFTGLTNGTRYMVRVTANNTVISGPFSAPVAVTPRTIPGAPPVTVFNGDGQIRVLWKIEDDGGSPVDKVRIMLYSGDVEKGPFDVNVGVLNGFTAQGLTNGQTYFFTVAARNVVGHGPVTRVSGVPQVLPSVPLDLELIPGDGQIVVRWKPPANSDTIPVANYRLYIGSSVPELEPYRIIETPETSFTVTGLTNGRQYVFSLTSRCEGCDYGESTQGSAYALAAP